MTPPHLRHSTGLLARSALAALVLAGCASAGASQQSETPSSPTRTAILADTGATIPSTANATIRRTPNPLDAQAQATRLAAEGYTTIIAIGPSSRAAVSQAASAEVGHDTTWRTR
jgi:cytochrome c556